MPHTAFGLQCFKYYIIKVKGVPIISLGDCLSLKPSHIPRPLAIYLRWSCALHILSRSASVNYNLGIQFYDFFLCLVLSTLVRLTQSASGPRELVNHAGPGIHALALVAQDRRFVRAHGLQVLEPRAPLPQLYKAQGSRAVSRYELQLFTIYSYS